MLGRHALWGAGDDVHNGRADVPEAVFGREVTVTTSSREQCRTGLGVRSLSTNVSGIISDSFRALAVGQGGDVPIPCRGWGLPAVRATFLQLGAYV